MIKSIQSPNEFQPCIKGGLPQKSEIKLQTERAEECNLKVKPGAPEWLDQEIYLLIIADEDEFYLPEREFKFTDLDSTLKALISREWEDVKAVILLNPYENQCYEVSDRIAEIWWDKIEDTFLSEEHELEDIPNFIREFHPYGQTYFTECIETLNQQIKAEKAHQKELSNPILTDRL